MLGHCVDMQYFVSFLSFAIIFLEKRERERADCFTFIIFLMSPGCHCLFASPTWCVQFAIVAFPGHTHFLWHR